MTTDKKLAFVFPGQGSQSVGMLAALADKYPAVRSTFDEAADILACDLWDLVQNGPESELNNTKKTQPALLTASIAVWRIWQEHNGPLPSLMAGHSLGEYSALVCAGSITFPDAVSLVSERGACMQISAPEGTGGMAAILGLTDKQVQEVCRQSARGEIVTAANFNAPGQVVIAGHSDAVRRAVTAAKEAGARRSVLLQVSIPSHCALMQEAAQHFAGFIQNVNIKPPAIPVVHNVDASCRQDSDAIKQALIEQLYQPVRWVETIENMIAQGITQFIECGPGRVLSGLIKRIDRRINTISMYDPSSLEQALSEISTIKEV